MPRFDLTLEADYRVNQSEVSDDIRRFARNIANEAAQLLLRLRQAHERASLPSA